MGELHDRHPRCILIVGNIIVGWVLQGGVLISAAIIVIGILLKALQPNKFAPQKLQLFPQTFDHMWADCSSCLSSASVSQQEVQRNWLWH